MPLRERPRKIDAIHAAALALLTEHGYDALTVESVAVRAGVNKTTIYRYWDSKDTLLAEALLQSPALQLRIPDTGSLRGDLIDLASQIAKLLTSPSTRRLAVPLFAAGPDHPATAAAAAEFFAERLNREQVIFDRACARSEISPTTESATVMDMIAGAIWLRHLARNKHADTDYITYVVDSALNGIATRTTSKAGPISRTQTGHQGP